jgi:hypothetical protein
LPAPARTVVLHARSVHRVLRRTRLASSIRSGAWQGAARAAGCLAIASVASNSAFACRAGRQCPRTCTQCSKNCSSFKSLSRARMRCFAESSLGLRTVPNGQQGMAERIPVHHSRPGHADRIAFLNGRSLLRCRQRSYLLGHRERRLELSVCLPRRTAMSSDVRPRLDSCSLSSALSHARMRCLAGSS